MQPGLESNRSDSSVEAESKSPKLFPMRRLQDCTTSHAAQLDLHDNSRRSTQKVLSSALLVLGIIAVTLLGAPSPLPAAPISIGISVRIAPPPIPVYTQPVCPGPGMMWTPGYWGYDPDNGYYWVPGTWVMAPAPGLLWTPGYWGWGDGAFFWHGGYWGPHVGFYGGINYGFGYIGVGFVGGEWRGREFFYNRGVVNVGGGRITNVYYQRVTNNFYGGNRVSYNGGAGGITARPGREELAAEHERHIDATSMQRQHEAAAHGDRAQFVSMNHGAPAVAATGRAGEFRGGNVVRATRAGGPINEGAYRGNTRQTGPAASSHAGGYSGFHNPSANPGGANRPLATSNPDARNQGPSRPPHGGPATELGRPSNPSHGGPVGEPERPSRPSYAAPANRPAPTHGSPSHQAPATEHSSRPSGGEKGPREQSDTHHQK